MGFAMLIDQLVDAPTMLVGALFAIAAFWLLIDNPNIECETDDLGC